MIDDGAAIRSQVLGGLKSHQNQATVALATAIGVPESSRKALTGSLATYGGIISRLEPTGDLGRGALLSSSSHDHWVRVAKDVWNGITNVMQNLGRSSASWSNVWSETSLTISSAVEAVQSAATKIADAVPDKSTIYIVLGLVAVIVVGAAVVKVG